MIVLCYGVRLQRMAKQDTYEPIVRDLPPVDRSEDGFELKGLLNEEHGGPLQTAYLRRRALVEIERENPRTSINGGAWPIFDPPRLPGTQRNDAGMPSYPVPSIGEDGPRTTADFDEEPSESQRLLVRYRDR